MLTAQSIEKELKARGMGEVIRVGYAAKLLGISQRTIQYKLCNHQIKEESPRRGVVSRAALSVWLSEDPYYAAALNMKKSSEGAVLPGADIYNLYLTVKA